MRRHALLVCGLKAQRIKVLRRRIRLGKKQINTRESPKEEAHVGVRPDGRVVVGSKDTDQTDGTFRRTNKGV